MSCATVTVQLSSTAFSLALASQFRTIKDIMLKRLI